ncbi:MULTISPECIES: ABC transporter ATP-binding protein [Nitrosomonas]|uniref:ABC transport system ATP-binding protein n=2 Tax=Nitrosomonas eutropha TaxID=916 RepID=A0ABX5M5R7_9PROT|nr:MULTISPECIES: ABC transporter ATP-binding protein [Nitrosomonas]ABI59592.1 ABC transporter-related protein [Nitrosomonas eutropha C91]MXS79880.1 ABC transporter ATP-binding protein [Nitrosomonas sp. GH22]PXV79809.1 putative ABC transport system ATP-binding protein [Nitrosomonas eutropha]SCX09948.1 putative ABC transport system ATP-binding protein [Nitrosomonas eutropha]SDW93835.1 putative ABC transport system ATP-binding protein [Nitrosomonas eutropha]
MIQLQGITRIFHMGDQAIHALDHIDLTIDSGEYVSIMGPSGSGKSTLLNVIGLLDRPDSGHYLLDGRDVTALSETEQAQVRREKIGFVFQSFHLIPRLTAAENIEIPLILTGMPSIERKERIAETLQAFNLSDRAHHRPAELSGGQRQRVAIARATILRPTALLADEPTGNLDHRIGSEVATLLEALNQTGTTLIVVTHDRELALRARRRVAMHDGRIETDEQ